MPKKAADGRKKRQRKGKNNNLRDWAGLNDYLLEDVMGRLPLADCSSFGSVCKPWRNIASNVFDGSDRNVPCLMKCGQNVITAKSCVGILANSDSEIEFPDAHERCILGSFQDWLFLGRRERKFLHISMLNPVSGENILLPKAMSIFYMMVVSAIPSDENCVCMLVGPAKVAFCTPGSPIWQTRRIMTNYVLDALYRGGRFYLLGDNSIFFMFHLKNLISNVDPKTFDMAISIKLPDAPKSQFVRYYLVESCGEILLVCQFYFANDEQIVATSAFEIYRPGNDVGSWLKLETLKDQIFFIGTGCSKSFHAKEFGDAFANNVYFIDHGPFTRLNGWDHHGEPVIRSHKNNLGFFSFRGPNNKPSVFQARAEGGAGSWLTAPLGWCLKKRHAD